MKEAFYNPRSEFPWCDTITGIHKTFRCSSMRYPDEAAQLKNQGVIDHLEVH